MHTNLCTYTDLRNAGTTVVDFIEMAIGLAVGVGIPLRVRLEREVSRGSKTGRRLTDPAWRMTRQAILQHSVFCRFVRLCPKSPRPSEPSNRLAVGEASPEPQSPDRQR